LYLSSNDKITPDALRASLNISFKDYCIHALKEKCINDMIIRADCT
jgi:hypothetical protein